MQHVPPSGSGEFSPAEQPAVPEGAVNFEYLNTITTPAFRAAVASIEDPAVRAGLYERLAGMRYDVENLDDGTPAVIRLDQADETREQLGLELGDFSVNRIIELNAVHWLDGYVYDHRGRRVLRVGAGTTLASFTANPAGYVDAAGTIIMPERPRPAATVRRIGSAALSPFRWVMGSAAYAVGKIARSRAE